MAEEQNHDSVTLADIMEKIKDMRNEAEAQHQDSKLFAAYLFSGAVLLAGIGFYMPLITPYWQMSNAVGFMSLGMGSAIGLLTYHQLLERRKRKALKGK